MATQRRTSRAFGGHVQRQAIANELAHFGAKGRELAAVFGDKAGAACCRELRAVDVGLAVRALMVARRRMKLPGTIAIIAFAVAKARSTSV